MTKPAGDFYVSRDRLSTYCKACQRVASRRAAMVDPDRERRNGRIRTAAVRRLIATYRAEYRALLREERARLGGGANAA